MKRYLLFFTIVALVSGGIGRAASNPRTDAGAAKDAAQAKNVTQAKGSTAQSKAEKQATGDEIFQANCGRCHVPPMSISPRITGTVIMHMRARARLSREDEIQLLKFMAP